MSEVLMMERHFLSVTFVLLLSFHFKMRDEKWFAGESLLLNLHRALNEKKNIMLFLETFWTFYPKEINSKSFLSRYPGEGNGNPLQYFCLKNPMDRGTWQATLHWVAKSRTRLSD